MSINSYTNILCGVEIKFKTTANAERIRTAMEFVDKGYRRLQESGNQMGRESLLALLALGLADDLLELQKEHREIENKVKDDEQTQARLTKMIENLESMISK